MAQFQFGGFILDTQIGDRNLSVDELQAVLFRDFAFAVESVFFRSQQGQIVIQIPFEFIVEEHADRAASAALDAGNFLLIEPVEIGVVFDFAGFHQAVVDGLVVGHLIRVLENAMPGFRKGHDTQGLFV